MEEEKTANRNRQHCHRLCSSSVTAHKSLHGPVSKSAQPKLSAEACAISFVSAYKLSELIQEHETELSSSVLVAGMCVCSAHIFDAALSQQGQPANARESAKRAHASALRAAHAVAEVL